MTYHNFDELCTAAEKHGGLAAAVAANEMDINEITEAELYARLADHWQVMQASITKALGTPQSMPGGLISGQAQKQQKYSKNGGVCGTTLNAAMAMALSASEVNAAMGRICAAPTAGACGVLPAALTAAASHFESSEKEILNALLVAGGVGAVITRNATVSGAEAGCQAECGAAAAMAAAAVVCLAGGSAQTAGNAVSIALMNCMGLVCDPIAGLVQMPCSFRNASQTANALLSADMALAGQNAVIPPDEAIEAMARVGHSLPAALRETSMGGIAATPTGRKIKKQLANEGNTP